MKGRVLAFPRVIFVPVLSQQWVIPNLSLFLLCLSLSLSCFRKKHCFPFRHQDIWTKLTQIFTVIDPPNSLPLKPNTSRLCKRNSSTGNIPFEEIVWETIVFSNEPLRLTQVNSLSTVFYYSFTNTRTLYPKARKAFAYDANSTATYKFISLASNPDSNLPFHSVLSSHLNCRSHTQNTIPEHEKKKHDHKSKRRRKYLMLSG